MPNTSVFLDAKHAEKIGWGYNPLKYNPTWRITPLKGVCCPRRVLHARWCLCLATLQIVRLGFFVFFIHSLKIVLNFFQHKNLIICLGCLQHRWKRCVICFKDTADAHQLTRRGYYILQSFWVCTWNPKPTMKPTHKVGFICLLFRGLAWQAPTRHCLFYSALAGVVIKIIP